MMARRQSEQALSSRTSRCATACTPSATNISSTTVRAIARALDRAGVDAIEICHGDGITGSTFNYGFGAHDDCRMDRGGRRRVHSTPSRPCCCCRASARSHDLKHAYAAGARSVRVATHCTEADVSSQHIEAARKLGMDTVGFLMMAHMIARREAGRAGAADGKLWRRMRLCHRLGRRAAAGRNTPSGSRRSGMR